MAARHEGNTCPGRTAAGCPRRSEPALTSVSEVTSVPTVGVEEEFLLVDRGTGAPVACAPAVIKRAAESLGPQVQAELFPTQIEVCTLPVRTPDELRADLRRLRRAVAAAADEVRATVVASGTPVVPSATVVEVSDRPRYLRMAAEFGAMTEELVGGVCGCHVHVGMPDREHAVRLGSHLRPWLPVLQALSSNSPFRAGRDSGYASWRAMRWSQWPGVGPAPLLADEAAYERLVGALVGSGALLDRGMIYWYARPSEHCPTLEIRVADVNADLDTVVLLALLVRGLAAALLTEVRAGVPAPEVPDPLLRAAHWRAARDGMEGQGIDLFSGRARPAAELADELIARAAPGLRAAGDLELAGELLRRLRTEGGGAARQRAAYRLRGELRDVVGAVAVR